MGWSSGTGEPLRLRQEQLEFASIRSPPPPPDAAAHVAQNPIGDKTILIASHLLLILCVATGQRLSSFTQNQKPASHSGGENVRVGPLSILQGGGRSIDRPNVTGRSARDGK